MKAKLQKIALIPLFLIITIFTSCQSTKNEIPLPQISLQNGTLENGMKYYLAGSTENTITLRLIVKAGSLMEDDDQLGIAHFVEHMAFNGSEHFSKNKIVSFYESIGMVFGQGLNASTGSDTTQYFITIPKENKEALKKGFLFLKDIANGLSFEEEEIEKERGVIIEEWRLREEKPEGRFSTYLYKILYQNTRYADRLPIGDMEIIRNISSKRIVDFYEKWYRPDLMTISLEGNITFEEAEQYIKEIFSDIPKAKGNPPEIEKDKIKNVKEVYFYEDKELANTTFSLFERNENVPLKSQEDYKQYLIENIVFEALAERLEKLSFQENSPISYFGASSQENNNAIKTKLIEFCPKKNREVESLSLIIEEIQKIQKNGLSKTEIEDVSKKMSPSNNAYLKNIYTDSVAMNYVSEKNLISKLLSTITEKEINNAAKKLFKNNGDFLIVSSPNNTELDQKAITKIWKNTKLSKNQQNEKTEETTGGFITPKEKGFIVNKEDLSLANNIKQYTLSNGVKVILKQVFSEDETIHFNFMKPGGLSLLDDSEYPSALVASQYSYISGYNDISYLELSKIMQEKGISINQQILAYSDSINGTVKTSEFETLMQIIYLMFTKPNFTENSWNQTSVALENKSKTLEVNPTNAFMAEMTKVLYDGDIRKNLGTSELISQIDKDIAEKIYKEKFTDASNYTLILVGDFLENKIAESLETYIATLPSSNKKLEEPIWHDNYSLKENKTFTMEKGNGELSCVLFSFVDILPDLENAPANQEIIEAELLDCFSYLLEISLFKKIREEQSGIYDISVNSSTITYPKRSYYFEIAFFCDPNRAEELANEVINQIEVFKRELVSQNHIDTIINTYNQNNNASAIRKNDNYWLSKIEYCLLNNYPYDDIVDNTTVPSLLTQEKIRELANMYLKNYVLGILKPENISK